MKCVLRSRRLSFELCLQTLHVIKVIKIFFQLHIFLGTSILQIPLTRKMFYSLFHISQTTKISAEDITLDNC